MTIELPDQPRRFRVHKPPAEPQDCTLHPDGRMSRELCGQTLWSMLSFDAMLDMNWADAEIEWDPAPAEDTAPVPASEADTPLALFDAAGGAR
ncbi:hypothetical protein [Kitasatospora sp. NPDC090091]|uniref:hypothetical protein n=1 Tax=Kitasatospora sp. NPDC090091 TaxID=3364081 RepID=UPI003828E1B7